MYLFEQTTPIQQSEYLGCQSKPCQVFIGRYAEKSLALNTFLTVLDGVTSIGSPSPHATIRPFSVNTAPGATAEWNDLTRLWGWWTLRATCHSGGGSNRVDTALDTVDLVPLRCPIPSCEADTATVIARRSDNGVTFRCTGCRFVWSTEVFALPVFIRAEVQRAKAIGRQVLAPIRSEEFAEGQREGASRVE